MDGAMPVEARKNPKSMATIAGPALIDFPLIRHDQHDPQQQHH